MRRLADLWHRHDRPQQPTYPTYEAALAACNGDGYEHGDLVNVICAKTYRYRDELSDVAIATRLNPAYAYSLCGLLASIDASRMIYVIDFGGACGAHYYLARAMLPSPYKLRWIVVETLAMAQKAGAAATSDELSFSSDLRAAVDSLKRVDLLHTSGALQYVSDPHDCLRTLVSSGAKHMLFNRLGLTKGPRDVIGVQESWLSQNGPGDLPRGFQDRQVRYPFTFMPESSFYEVLRENYDVVMTFDEPSAIFPVNDEPIIGRGLLVRLRR